MRMLQSIQSFVNNYFVVVDHEETATHELQRQVEASYSKKVLLQKKITFMTSDFQIIILPTYFALRFHLMMTSIRYTSG